MTIMEKEIIPKGFFNVSQKIITTKEALKDVIPVKWDKAKMERKSNKSIVNLIDNNWNRQS